MTLTCKGKSSVCGSYIMCQVEVTLIRLQIFKRLSAKYSVTALLEYLNTALLDSFDCFSEMGRKVQQCYQEVPHCKI